MTLKTYLNQTTEQQTTKDNANCNQSEKNVESTWSKFTDLLTQPLSRVVEITKIRFDSHMYIEIKLSCFTCSIKLCITSLWIIFFIIYSKM